MLHLFGIVFWGFALAYVAAIGIWLLGSYGLFGVERDPLSAVYLVVLGQPWVQFVNHFPERFWPYISALTPGVNLVILGLIVRMLR